MRPARVHGGMAARRACALALATGLWVGAGPTAAGAEPGARSADDIQRCSSESRPQINTVEIVELVSTDPLGDPSTRRSMVYSGHTRDGLRAVWFRLLSPSELRGSSFLIIEREDDRVETFIQLASLPDLRRIEGRGPGDALFGTDFSAEDLSRLYGMNRPGQASRLADETRQGRRIYVLRVRPDAGERSSYESIVLHVDQDTCVAIGARMYEGSERLRKEMSVETDSLQRIGDGWIARDLTMYDRRDGTHTRLRVESVESGDDVLDLPFDLDQLP